MLSAIKMIIIFREQDADICTFLLILFVYLSTGKRTFMIEEKKFLQKGK